MPAPNYRLFTPSYPFVIVQRIPRETETQSGIILTNDENKPLHEGIVLATWEPWNKHVSEATRTADDGVVRHLVETVVAMVSEFEPGDRVFFPHYGADADPSEPDILFVREAGEGAIIGKIPAEESATIREQVADVVNSSQSVQGDAVAESLFERFVIVPKRSISTSGKSTEGL